MEYEKVEWFNDDRVAGGGSDSWDVGGGIE